MKWIKDKYGENLVIVRPGQRGYLDSIERAICSGDVVLIEQIEEELDPVLDPVLGRNTIKKGRAIKLGDKEVSRHTHTQSYFKKTIPVLELTIDKSHACYPC